MLEPHDDRVPAHCGSVNRLSIAEGNDGGTRTQTRLCEFFAGNATASALPLLAAIALRKEGSVSLPYLDNAWLHLAYKP